MASSAESSGLNRSSSEKMTVGWVPAQEERPSEKRAWFASLNPPYGTIVADPPWRYRKSKQADGTEHSRTFVSDMYDTMTMQEIAALPVASLAAPDAHLYLWVTVPRLFGERDEPGFGPVQIMQEWGFRYVTMLTWIKTGAPGMGSYFRIDTEHVLFGVKGHAPIPPKLRKRNVISAPRRAHSQKPDELFQLAELVSPERRLELFARDRKPGWDSWGNQIRQDLFTPATQEGVVG